MPSYGSVSSAQMLHTHSTDPGTRSALLARNTTNQVRGLAILIVMLGHLSANGRFVLPRLSGAWGVSIFLVLSGYGLFRSYSRHGLGHFIGRRVTKVLVPYSLVTAVWILVDLVALGRDYSVTRIALALIGLDFTSAVDGTMWFVTFLLLWYAAFYTIFRFIGGNSKRLISLVLFGALLFALKDVFPAGSGASLHTLDVPCGVLLGMLAAKLEAQSANLRALRAWTATVLAVSLAVALALVGRMSSGAVVYVTADFAVTGVVLSLFQLLSTFNWNMRLLATLGDYSYGMYLLEGAVLLKYRSLQPGDGWPWLTGILLVFGLSIVLMKAIAGVVKTSATIRAALSLKDRGRTRNASETSSE